MKKHLLKSLLALALVLISGNAWGTEENETITFSSLGYSNAAEVASVTGTNVELTLAKGTNTSNSPKYYDTGTGVRLYSGNTMTVTSTKSGYKISKVVFTYSGNGYTMGNATVSTGNYSTTNATGTWTGLATSFTITSAATCRLQKMDITLSDASAVTATVTIDKSIILPGEKATVSTNGPALTLTTNNSSIASVSGTEVKGEAAGYAVITATWAEGNVGGVDYAAGSKELNVRVFAVEDGVFDFTVGYDYGSNLTPGTSAVEEEKTFTAGNVTAVASVSYVWYTDYTLRLYTGGKLVLNAPTDKVITKVVFTGVNMTNGTVQGVDFGNGENNTWTGQAETVTVARKSGTVQIKTMVVTYGEKSDKEIATLTIDKTTIGVGVSTATITSNPAGLVVSYVSDHPEVATVSDGVITGVAGGSVKVTASWDEQVVGTKTYAAGSAEFNVTVKAIEDGKFNFESKMFTYGSGIATTADGNHFDTDPSTWTAGNVTMVVSGKYRWWNNDGTLRLYANTPNSSLTISVPDGKLITKIVAVGGTNLVADQGEKNETTWTGASKTVVLSYTATSSSANLKSITVTYVDNPLSVTISSAGWATACIPFQSTMSGATAYIVTGTSGDALTLSEVTGEIPANTGLLLKGAGTVTFTASNGTPADVTGNMLVGTSDAGGKKFNAANTTYYILANDPTDGLGFYYQVDGGASATCAQYKAVLAVPGSSSAIGFRLDGATMINAVPAAAEDVVIYDLTGRRVENATRGIYIVNGKKMLVK